VWNRWRGSPWHTAAEAGLAPIAAGLVLAGAFAMLRDTGVLAWAAALAVAACRIWRPGIHPLALLALGAALFALAQG
jgi:chromate transporter